MISVDPLYWYYRIQQKLEARNKARNAKRKANAYVRIRYAKFVLNPVITMVLICIETFQFFVHRIAKLITKLYNVCNKPHDYLTKKHELFDRLYSRRK